MEGMYTWLKVCIEEPKLAHELFPFLEGRGGEGLRDLIQIKGPRVLDFFFAYPLAPGFLVALTEPGNNVSLKEFQGSFLSPPPSFHPSLSPSLPIDWYNNEHIPLRLNHLPSFLTGARFAASDSKAPTWLAVYDITDTSAFSDESYTRLRSSRSKREADLVAWLEVLDRRTCVLLQDSGESGDTTSLGAERPPHLLCTHGLDLGDDEEEVGSLGGLSRVLRSLGGMWTGGLGRGCLRFLIIRWLGRRWRRLRCPVFRCAWYV